MTPLDMGLQMKETGKTGPQVTICFKQNDAEHGNNGGLGDSVQGSRVSLEPGSRRRSTDHTCLCLETFGSNYLGFHNMSNTTLHEIVTSLLAEWPPGLLGVSSGVASVISDYLVTMPHTLPADSSLLNQKYIQLNGEPWTNDDVRQTHRLQMVLIACLLKVGHKIMVITNILVA